MSEIAPPAAAPRDPLIGMRVGSYTIVSCLAKGGMGAVYTATHEALGIRRVIKVLLPDCARHPGIVQRFRAEAAMVARLNHHHVVEIHDFGVLENGQGFLMLPFLDGAPLDVLLARTPGQRFTLHRALKIILQVASALAHAHAHGIVHRDLKPGNVFLVKSPRETREYSEFVKLLDFGIAKDMSSVDGVTRTGFGMGTPGYMALEQYGDAAHVTAHADVFSLGVMAFEMVTGLLPWGTYPPYMNHEQPQMPDPRLMPSFWPEFYRVLLAALARHPLDRPASVAEFAVALASTLPAVANEPSGEAMLEELTPFRRGAIAAHSAPGPVNDWEPVQLRTTLTAANGVPAAAPVTPPTKRSRRTAVVGGAVAMVAIAALIIIAAFNRSESEPDAAATGSAPPTPTAPAERPAAPTHEPAMDVTLGARLPDAGTVDAAIDLGAAPETDAAITESATEPERRTPVPKRTAKEPNARTKRAVTSKVPTTEPSKAPPQNDDFDPDALAGGKK